MSKLTNKYTLNVTNEYQTPQWLFDHFDRIFNFELDVCASDTNTKCDAYFTMEDIMEDSALESPWLKANWMNPSDGKEINKWVEKAYNEGLDNNLVVCLLPARTHAKWWHDYVMKADAIHYIKGMFKYGNQTDNSVQFPSCVVIFGLFNYENRTSLT